METHFPPVHVAKSSSYLSFIEAALSYLPFKWRQSHLFTLAPPPEKLCPDSTVLKSDYERVVCDFLQNVSYEIPAFEYRHELKAKVESRMREANVPDELIQRLQGVILTAVGITQAAYAFIPFHLQEIIALYAAITIGIDDLAEDIPSPLRSYAGQVVRGEEHDHILLTALTQWLSKYAQSVFGVFSGDMIIKATVDFISASYYELDGPIISKTVQATDFAEYFRYKSGDSEGFAFMLFPEEVFPEDQFLRDYLPAMPYIIRYMNFVNDILSFYKEELCLDRANFIHAHASESQTGVLESLQQIADCSVRTFQDIRRILSGNPRLQKAAEQFLHGYLAFHLGQRRYRLIELDIPAAVEAKDFLKPRQ
ncbi:hypothetical protein N7490_003662 [Penicillium lividum]|nr:hypothetical protein N7490_003662 [Penicillium lividum]